MSNSRKTKPVKKAEYKGYHNVNLSKDDGLLFEAWKVGQSIQLSDLDILANNGYKFSLGWDEYHQGVVAALYAKDAKMEWAGYTLSAWAADTETAILLLFYKHYIMCEETWEVAKDKPDRPHAEYG